MPHSIEVASSGRAKCRGCGQTIAKDTLRLGERGPNPYGDGEATYWFHVICGAMRRPEPAIEAIEAFEDDLADRERLLAWARQGVDHHRLPRISDLQRAKSGRARCRQCRELIPKAEWRIVLTIWEEGRFNPMGYIHHTCAGEYFGVADIGDRLHHVAADAAKESAAQ